MIENIHSVCINTAYVCAAGVGAAVVAYGAARGMKFLSGGVKCVTAVSLAGSLIFGGMVVTSVHVAGAKTNDTNQIENGKWKMENAGGRTTILRSPFSILHSTSPITDDDIAAGWREISRSNAALAPSVFAKPDDAVVWEAARARGVRRGFWKIPFGGWDFPGGGTSWSNGFVWAEGMFRPRVNSKRDGFALLDHGLALAPAANWSRYGLDASLFWCRTNAVGGLVGTFLGAAVDDDPAKIVSAQFELFPSDGRIALRYDLARAGEGPFSAGPFENGTNHFAVVSSNTAEIVFQRVHPDDWDMDGIPNGMDADPRVAAANAGWNQSDTWAMLAFPSNAAEIAAAGYAAWATARAADPNRRLVGLRVSSASGSWPLLLTFGGLQVMCDGKQEIVFAIDCGAHYPFSISDGGKLEFVALHADVDDVLSCFAYGYPYERWAGDVVAHLDSPSSGWIGRTAEVTVDGLDGSHFFPDDSTTVTAVVTNCHEDAYVSCTWSGGEGFTFTDAHSLSTTVCWNGDEVWATNYVTCVTTYEGGYAVTNSQAVTVGGSDEPPLRLSMTGQDVYFLNDYDNGNRTERVYRVSFELQGPRGTTGNLSVNSIGGAEMKFFFEKGLLGPATNSIPMSIGEDAYSCTTNLYLACPELGRGRVEASFRSDGWGIVSTSRPCRVIEPLRRFVTNETYPNSRQYVNPSCLVYGTNAVLRVDVRTGIGGEFGSNEMDWVKISGPCSCVTNGWYLEVTPTATNGVVEIEARFNEDEIQPRFKLPIVCQKIVGIHAFIVEAPERYADSGWSVKDVQDRVNFANEVFGQVGIQFRLLSVDNADAGPIDWIVRDRDEVYEDGKTNLVLSAQCRRLFADNHYEDGIDVLFTGGIEGHSVSGFTHGRNIVLGDHEGLRSLAHELGHVFSLKDCYDRFKTNGVIHIIYEGDCPLSPGHFDGGCQDWGAESRRGFYGLEDDLSSVLQKLLMFGFTGEDGVDIPQFRVMGLKKNAVHEFQDEKSEVGAHFIDFRNLKGLMSEEK